MTRLPLTLLALLALAGSVAPALADDTTKTTVTPRDYIFVCKNDWNQEIEVPITGLSVEDARAQLKTNADYASNYSTCAYRRETAAKIKKHHSDDDDTE